MSLGLQPRLLQRHFHRAIGARAFGVRRGDVIGVARQAVADHLGIDLRAARLGVLIFLEHDHARALAHDEAVAVPVVGPAGFLRLVVEIGAERARLGEAGDADRADRRFGAAGEHDVGIVRRDHPRRVADRMGAGRASGDHRMVRPHQPVFDRHLAGDEVDQAAVDEVRADPARPLFVQDERSRFSMPGRPPMPEPIDTPARSRVCLVHLDQAGVLDRLAGGIDAVDDERVDLALDLVVDALVGIEAIFMVGRLHLAGDAALLVAGVELGDRPRAALARRGCFPSWSRRRRRAASPDPDLSRRHGACQSLQMQQAQTRSG